MILGFQKPLKGYTNTGPVHYDYEVKKLFLEIGVRYRKFDVNLVLKH